MAGDTMGTMQRRARPLSLSFLLLFLFDCPSLTSCAGRAEPEPPSPPPPTAESPADRAPDPDPVVAAHPAAEDAPPEPAPAVTLAHQTDRFGHVSFSLTNRGEGPTHVALGLVLERADDAGTFAPAEDLGRFELLGVGEGSCAELLPGAELRERWACLRADQRGEGTHGCTPAAAGRYRFVATSCDGRSRTEGAAFAYP